MNQNNNPGQQGDNKPGSRTNSLARSPVRVDSKVANKAASRS
jgi:hypothetical protein